MSVEGWIFMALTWGVILTLIVFSYRKTIRSENGDDDSSDEVQ